MSKIRFVGTASNVPKSEPSEFSLAHKLFQVVRHHEASRPFIDLDGKQIFYEDISDDIWDKYLLSIGITREDFHSYPKPMLQAYYRAKTGLVISEFLLALLFISVGLTAFGMAFTEATSGTPSTFFSNQSGMIATVSTLAPFGFILVCVYAYFGRRLAQEGEEQLDQVWSNFWSFMAMIGIATGLAATWISHAPIDEDHRLAFRRLIYVTFVCQALRASYILSSTIFRHLAVEQSASFYQEWKQEWTTDNAGGVGSDGSKANHVVKYFTRAAGGKNFLVAFMGIYTLTLLALSAWLLTKGIFYDVMPAFKTFSYTYGIIMGTMIFALFAVWILWTYQSQQFDETFRVHFDVFYLGATAMPVAVMFFILGYIYNYRDVIAGGVVTECVIAVLKYNYWSKIVLVQLVMMPDLVSSVSQIAIIGSGFYPLGASYNPILQNSRHVQISA